MMPDSEMDVNNPDLIITSHKKVSNSHPLLHEYVNYSMLKSMKSKTGTIEIVT